MSFARSKDIAHSGVARVAALVAVVAMTGTLSGAEAETIHTYQIGPGTEIANTIPIRADKLRPLLPDDYELVPAAALGLGGWNQGIVVIVNFHGPNSTIDARQPHQPFSTDVDLAILVREPVAARLIGADIPGAFHFYSLGFYTDDAEYAASLRAVDMPVEFVPQIEHEREIDDDGVGTLRMEVPSRNSPFQSLNMAFGYAPAGALNVVFWHTAKRGTAVLHFQIEATEQGQAQSWIFTEPGSPLNLLLEGEGFGPGPTDPETGYESVMTPSLNLLYPRGTRGRLLWIPER